MLSRGVRIIDKYIDFVQLATHEEIGRDYKIQQNEIPHSNAIVTAIHGGGIEPGTSELALGISKGGFSYYLFEGIKPSNNRLLHLTATRFDEPNALDLIGKNKITVSLHGYDDQFIKNTYIGGLDKKLGAVVQKELEKDKFWVKQVPSRFAGDSKNNICNRNLYGKGVQLELSIALRKTFFENGDFSRKNRMNTTKEFTKYVHALIRALS